MPAVTSIKDRFDRADASDLGAAWRVELGNIQVVSQSARQVAGGSFAVTARAVYESELTEPACAVKAEVAIEAVTGAPYIELFARAKEAVEGSPFVTNRWYAVRLTSNADGTWTLALIKNIDGTPTTLASADVVPGSPDTELKNLKLSVMGVEDYVTLSAYFEDMDVADLSYADRTSPIWTDGGLAGFQIYEGAGQTDSDVAISGFEASAFVSVVEFPELIVPEPAGYTYEQLVEELRFRLDRGGNSQFSKEQALSMLGYGEQEIWNRNTRWWWAEYLVVRRTVANQFWYEMPPYVTRIILPFIPGSTMAMGIVSADRFFEAQPNYLTTTGTPRQIIPYGIGPNGGVRYGVWPVPDSEVEMYFLTYVKCVRPTLERIPLLPSQWQEALILNGLDRAFMYDTDVKVREANRGMLGRILRDMDRDNAIRHHEYDRFISEIERRIVRAADLLPVTRIDQLGRGL